MTINDLENEEHLAVGTLATSAITTYETGTSAVCVAVRLLRWSVTGRMQLITAIKRRG